MNFTLVNQISLNKLTKKSKSESSEKLKEYVKISIGEYQRLYDCEKELAVLKSEKSKFLRNKLSPVVNKIIKFLQENRVDIKLYGDINSVERLDQVVCDRLHENPEKMFIKIVR